VKFYVDLFLRGQRVAEWRYRSLVRAAEVATEVQDIVAQAGTKNKPWAAICRNDVHGSEGPFVTCDDAKLRVTDDAGHVTCSD
jgi:hypothetical protein